MLVQGRGALVSLCPRWNSPWLKPGADRNPEEPSACEVSLTRNPCGDSVPLGAGGSGLHVYAPGTRPGQARACGALGDESRTRGGVRVSYTCN